MNYKGTKLKPLSQIDYAQAGMNDAYVFLIKPFEKNTRKAKKNGRKH